MGVAADRIKVLGIPIDPRFAITQDKVSAKQRLKLNPWLPTILVMGGSQGLGPMAKIIKQLNNIRLPIQTIVICGKNNKLRRKLKKKSSRYGYTLRIMGFTRHIDKIMDACDMIITKPGGMTSSEALAKNLPLIITDPIPGQEEKNSQFLTGNHVALRLDNLDTLQAVIEYLIRHPQKLDNLRENTFKIARPNASLEAAGEILDLI
jgi:processive 1,2-diacylglycerol beta-glucosyltransferase